MQSRDAGPFHDGELDAQERTGMRERLAAAARGFRDYMPDQHRELFEQLPFMLAGSVDEGGRVWASLVGGKPGFVRSPDARTLTFEARPTFGDVLQKNLRVGAELGLLGIQLETRRRNRMNGVVRAMFPGAFSVEVVQSFGNCAKYIQVRHPEWQSDPADLSLPRPTADESALLSPGAVQLVRAADTFFIASASGTVTTGQGGVDVSHRGGKPGFVRVRQDRSGTTLAVPDFRGNFFFNTFGNVLKNPSVGLLFIDFETGSILQLTGLAEVIWDGPELSAYPGAERLLRIRVVEGRRIARAAPVSSTPPELATQLAATGDWVQER